MHLTVVVIKVSFMVHLVSPMMWGRYVEVQIFPENKNDC